MFFEFDKLSPEEQAEYHMTYAVAPEFNKKEKEVATQSDYDSDTLDFVLENAVDNQVDNMVV